MLPHSNFDMRYRTKRGLFSRFNMNRTKLQRKIDNERMKPETDQDKGLLRSLIDKIKDL